MSRYIDLDKLKEFDCDGVYCIKDGCAECFYNNGGVEDVAPVVHAKWETMYTKDFNNNCIIEEICYCSNCKHRKISKNNEYMLTEYCPNCGAKMKGID